MKQIYKNLEIEIIRFDSEDIITTSTLDPRETPNTPLSGA